MVGYPEWRQKHSISKMILLKEFPRYHSPLHLHSWPQPPPTHHIPNILLTQARRGRDLDHFEDVNFSKEAEVAVAADYSGLCVCVHARMHTHACTRTCMCFFPFSNSSNSSPELETDHYFLLSSSHDIVIPAQTTLPMSTLFAFLSG